MKTKVSMTIDKETKQEFIQEARKRGYTMSSRVNVLMERQLEKWKEE